MTTGDLTRPIVGIENRTAAEVFDIMCDRIRRARPAPAQEPVAVPAGIDPERACRAAEAANHRFGQWMPQRWLDLFIRAYNDGSAK